MWESGRLIGEKGKYRDEIERKRRRRSRKRNREGDKKEK